MNGRLLNSEEIINQQRSNQEAAKVSLSLQQLESTLSNVKERHPEIADDFKFDPSLYLELNPDVKAAGVDPYKHYLEFGINEGRRIR